jgi:tagatose 1,6-diphosphate aldolase
MLADPPIGNPPLRIIGGMGFRVGTTPEIETFSGNIGYHVYPAARGNRFAERACRLVFPLARRHGLDRIWITCNPDNLASRRTCERLGATLVDIVTIPLDHPFRSRGETAKCRYLIDLAKSPHGLAAR